MTKTGMISKHYKILIVFGLLDAFSFFRFLPRLITMLYGLCFFSDQDTTFFFYSCLLLSLLHVSYPFSAYGFLSQKKWAFILYDLQFPFRLLFFSVSLGFLSYINRPFESLTLHYVLGIVMLLAEVARLIINIILHRRAG